ncbi:MAG: hypothetical protein ACP5UQ_08505 [Anaerolineae bacterium]
MHIKQDWEIRFDETQFIAQAGEALSRLLARPGVQAEWQAALADARELVRPAAVWDEFAIQEFQHERLVLVGGAKIGGGPVVSVVAGASHLVMAVCTAGPALSARVSEHQRHGHRLRALFLDDLGSWAVDQVRQQLCRTIEANAAARGWRASAALSPGESEWSVTDQAVIFRVLDTRPIGVTLTESLVMSPIKSLSLIAGIGPGPLGIEGGSNCDFCTIRERCAYRRRR